MRLKRVGDHDLPLPARKTPGSAGYDLSSAVDTLIPPFTSILIPTGFAWEIDAATADGIPQVMPTVEYGAIFMRSGVAGDNLWRLAGLIDGDYRGEVMVRVYNGTSDERRIRKGERIAQLVIGVALVWPLEEVESLSETQRGAAGFGHSGV